MFTLKGRLASAHPFAVIYQQALGSSLVRFSQMICLTCEKRYALSESASSVTSTATLLLIGLRVKYIQVGIGLHFYTYADLKNVRIGIPGAGRLTGRMRSREESEL